MRELIAVFMGSGIGAVCRWQCQKLWNIADGWPVGTFGVNILGGLLAGVCLALATRLTGDARLFVVTGILGGFTTFSALSSEIIGMCLRGDWVSGAVYGFGSLLVGTIACWVGYFAAASL